MAQIDDDVALLQTKVAALEAIIRDLRQVVVSNDTADAARNRGVPSATISRVLNLSTIPSA